MKWQQQNYEDSRSGTDVMVFLNMFAEKFCDKMAFLTQNKAKFWKNLITTLVFNKNANIFAENWDKSQKIVIITSTPDAIFWWRDRYFTQYECTNETPTLCTRIQAVDWISIFVLHMYLPTHINTYNRTFLLQDYQEPILVHM
jgi:hypothetical protein